MKLGCKFDPYDGRDLMYRTRRSKLPPRVDNREYVTPIKNQGPEGSCVGFAVAKAVEMAFWKSTLECPNLSERWAYEYAKKHDEWPGENYEGSSIRGGLKAANKIGICLEDIWPYKARRKGKPRTNKSKKFKIEKYTRVNGLADIKAAVFSKGLVVAGAMVHNGWNKPNRQGFIRYNPRMRSEGGHAFVIVGYGGKGFWVANSWGRRWGKRGFAILTYPDAKLHIIDAWTIKI